MIENITSAKTMAEIEKIIQDYIEIAKKQNRRPTRDEIVEAVIDNLEVLLKVGPEDGEKILIISGIALGIAIILEIEEKLKMN